MDISILLKEIELVARNNDYPILGREKGLFFGELIKKYQPRRILEIGTLIGYSAIIMASNTDAEGQIVSLECNAISAKLAQRNLKKAGFEERANVIVGKALRILPELRGGFDFVFIDANKGEYLEYFKLIEKLVTKKAVIAADNVGKFPGDMEEFLSYVRGNKKYLCENFKFDEDSMEVIKFI